MKECPKCKELNGENQTACWKCHTSLGPKETYKKICPKCGVIYSAKAVYCEECGSHLSVYSNQRTYSSSSESNTWMYVIAVFFTFIGIILGCIQIAKGENELGKSLIITSIVASVIIGVLLFMLGSCSMMMY